MGKGGCRGRGGRPRLATERASPAGAATFGAAALHPWRARLRARCAAHLFDDLHAVVAELVAPVLAGERPDLVLVVGADLLARAGVGRAGLGSAAPERPRVSRLPFWPWRISYSILMTRLMSCASSSVRRLMRRRARSPASFTASERCRVRSASTVWAMLVDFQDGVGLVVLLELAIAAPRRTRSA